jgi:hypothetical protein
MKLLLGGGRCEAASNRAIAVVGEIDFLEGSTDKIGRKKLRGFFFLKWKKCPIRRRFLALVVCITSISILPAPLFLSHKKSSF